MGEIERRNWEMNIYPRQASGPNCLTCLADEMSFVPVLNLQPYLDGNMRYVLTNSHCSEEDVLFHVQNGHLCPTPQFALLLRL